MTASAYWADARPVDRAAFYALACDPQRSCVVEACAGAGKTWMLVSRILRALLAGAQPQEILAITFTRKAAGEMRERLNDWLRSYASAQATPEMRVQALIERGVPAAQAQAWQADLAGLHDRLLRGARAVQIRTFHAWFSQLLRVAPLEQLAELGLQPDMTLIEDPQEHRAPVFARFHGAVLRDPALHRDYLALTARRGRSQLRKWLEAAWDQRVEFELADEAGVLQDSVPATPEGGAAAAQHPVHAMHGAPVRSLLAAAAAALRGLAGVRARDTADALDSAAAQDDPQVCHELAWAALVTQAGEPRKAIGGVAQALALLDALGALRARIAQFEASVEHGQMVGLARRLMIEYADYKRARGLADMADLERCGLALLRDATLSAWVQERLDARIRHVLIDEFQDTSPLQWHALYAWLSAYAGAGGGASGQRPPGVFIVGDPKQSIYRFRLAEPRVFEAAQVFIGEALHGVRLACDHTRRNAPEVLDVLNRVFEQAQRDGSVGPFRAHTTEEPPAAGAGVYTLTRVLRAPRAVRGAASLDVPWRDTLTTPRHTPEEILREREAQAVAEAVRSLIVHDGWRADDIFVLSRKRQSLRLVAQALHRLQVASAAVEDTALMLAPEARDLVALLDALACQRHALSLVQALRSPLFGLSDAELVLLAPDARSRHWWAALVDHEWPAQPALQRARALLLRWREAAARLPPHDLLDRIVHEGQLRERVAASVPVQRRAGALEAIDAVLAQALTLDAARYATPYNFVRALRRRVVQVATPAHAQAVQLLTVHGAKGLEAPIVFVMDADPQPPSTQPATLLVDWPVESARPRRCAFVYSEAACPPSLQSLMSDEWAARGREELNGLYVAMSRAKQRLIFSATEPSRPAPDRSWWARIEALAAPWPTPARDRPGDPAASVPPAVLWASPPLPAECRAGVAGIAHPNSAREPLSPERRLGLAVHRTLEWVAPRSQGPSSAEDDSASHLVALAAAAAHEFGAGAAATERRVRDILASPACARFFDPDQLLWAGNEVPVSARGEALRIDRLVCLPGGDGPVWWVLDYKLADAPQALPAYQDQLRRYRQAVRQAQPGAEVRCAFLTGHGALVELDPPDAPG